MQKFQPYEKLALIYDQLMSHVNYKNWAEYITNLFQYADIKVKSIVDISCGTGSLLKYFDNNKYHYFGCDLSHAMIKQARSKFVQNIFVVNDVNKIALKSNKFDSVLFLYDSLNYLQDEKQIDSLFQETNRILVSNGILIFDIITDLLCKTHYKNFEEEENWDECGYIRHSFYDEVNHVQHNDFRIKIGDEIFIENHLQKIFSEELISKSLNKNGFKIIAQLDDFNFHHSDDDSERIHYICVKQ